MNLYYKKIIIRNKIELDYIFSIFSKLIPFFDHYNLEGYYDNIKKETFCLILENTGIDWCDHRSCSSCERIRNGKVIQNRDCYNYEIVYAGELLRSDKLNRILNGNIS